MNTEQRDEQLIEKLASEINENARGRKIGELQNLRARRLGLTRNRRSLYGTIKPDYAYHWGGHKELQFNIGYDWDPVNEKDVFRHGVAFSLQPNRSVPDISIFRERIRKFNRYLDDHPKAFNDLSMWYRDDGGKRIPNYAPAPIPDSLVKDGVFVMLGATCPIDAVDSNTILDDFDRLMPLYEFVEGDSEASARGISAKREFEWIPGNSARVFRARFEGVERRIDIDLRHNKLQESLYLYLCEIHGKENVSGELNCGIGKRVDIVVRSGMEYTYYEIKTGYSPQSCIREAFGQLMEYSFWPGAQKARNLVVIGEPPLDKEASEYIDFVREEFKLPLAYQQFDGELLVS